MNPDNQQPVPRPNESSDAPEYVSHHGPAPPVNEGEHPALTRRQRRHRRKMIIAAIVIAVLLVGGAVFGIVKSRSKTTEAPPVAAATGQEPNDATTKTLIAESPPPTTASGSTNYVSSQQNLNLSFEYPSDWLVAPKQTTAAATTPITITSPTTTVTAADGGSVQAKVLVMIRPGGYAVSELISATAAVDSLQIAYAKPTASQRQYPFLTFVHLAAGSKTAGAFEELLITGGQQFKKGDVIAGDNLGSIDPLISAAFLQCQTTDCPVADAKPLGISDATWQSATIFKQTDSLLKSFKLN